MPLFAEPLFSPNFVRANHSYKLHNIIDRETIYDKIVSDNANDTRMMGLKNTVSDLQFDGFLGPG